MKPFTYICKTCAGHRLCHHMGMKAVFTHADLVAVARQCLGWAISESDGLDVTAERIVAEMLTEVQE